VETSRNISSEGIIKFNSDIREAKKVSEGINTTAGREGIITDDSSENTILIQKTLRCGQSFYYNGNVVVLGDVNPGAEIKATGSVVVMGALRGMVHAGIGNNESATVAAFKLQPTQLRIAGHITRAPEGEDDSAERPEIARIKDGVVTIEALHIGRFQY